jgi:hypothetical protein
LSSELSIVMAESVSAIHVFLASIKQDMDVLHKLVLGPAEGQARVPGLTKRVLPTDIVRGKRCHVDQLVVLGAELYDLHRAVETDQQRPDNGGASQFLQHLG